MICPYCGYAEDTRSKIHDETGWTWKCYTCQKYFHESEGGEVPLFEVDLSGVEWKLVFDEPAEDNTNCVDCVEWQIKGAEVCPNHAGIKVYEMK